jgi:hypothetical protein
VISGNKQNGVQIDPQCAANKVAGNYIGTDTTGKEGIPNATGVYVSGSSNFIGDEAPVTAKKIIQQASNLISGNKEYGVQIVNVLAALLGVKVADGNRIRGNFIGVNSDASAALPNQAGGVLVSGGTKNTKIGDDVFVGEENIISGNTGAGVKIDAGAQGVTLVQNYIGTGTDPMNKKVKLPNIGSGIDLSTLLQTAPPVTIEKPNVIGNQGNNNINDPNMKAKIAKGTTIFAAGGLGIDIGAPGVTLAGMPVITSVLRNGTTVQITGTLSSTPNGTFDLAFYPNTQPNPSGYGKGETYLGGTTVAIDGNGNASFTVTLTPSSIPASQVDFVSAFATDDSTDGTSSEFSRVARAYNPGTIGGEVWNDYNTNGILDPYEAGLSDATVNLFSANGGILVATTTTDLSGYYEFDNQATGNYYVQFVAPSGYEFSPQNAGSNTTTNSLADPTTGDTPSIALASGSSFFDVNAGFSDTRPAPSVSLTSDANPSVYGQDVTFTATVSASSGTPTGTVTFFDGTTPIGTGVLDSTGTATVDISSLAVGSHTIQTIYNGDANDAPAKFEFRTFW